ncbi:MAG: BBP7 family outer membrane beta-barrel protein [Candidatus Babeliales bacterium]
MQFYNLKKYKFFIKFSLPIFFCFCMQVNAASSSHTPRCILSAEAIIFDRVGTAKYTLVERVPGATYFLNIPATPGDPALNSTNLKQGFCPGFRLGAAYHVDSKHDLLLSFFRIGDWKSTRSIGPDNPLDWLTMRAPGGFFQTQDFTYQSMTWDYSTKLYNAELNMQKKFSNVITMFVGFRLLQLHENLQGTIPPPDLIQPLWKNYLLANIEYVAWFEKQPGTPAPEYPPFWNTRTTNNLYGIQIGMIGKLFKYKRFLLNGLIKIGGYLNHASESTGVSIAKIVYDSGASANHLAFIGEVDLQCKYQITNMIVLKIGYEALWVNGVSLAPGQINETYSNSMPTSVSTLGVSSNSHVLFHGGSAGLELSF